MRLRFSNPLVLLTAFVGASVLVLGGLVMLSVTHASPPPDWREGLAPYAVPSDTDTVAVPQALDTLGLEESAGEALQPDTLRAMRYLGSFRRDTDGARLLPRRRTPLSPGLGNYWRHDIRLDTTGRYYIAREIVGDRDVRYPIKTDLETYRRERHRADMEATWRDLVVQRARQRTQRRGGLGVSIVIPGGRQSAFTSIFGKPEVDLRVNGQANIDAGFAYQQSEQQLALTGRGGRVDPRFGQNIRLGVTGTIGDKLRVDVNWDTERDFDYQNQLKLEYTGYEDEIIQSIVAGNVFLQTPSTLISGGQSLFGIKSELQFGGLRLTTVMSQQEGESDEIMVDGGSQTTEFDLRPWEYEENMHFFASFYFRNRWEPAYSTPPEIQLGPDFGSITDIEVFKLVQSQQEQDDVYRAVALADLGEPSTVLDDPDQFRNNPPLPDPALDQYTQGDLNFLREGDNSSTDIDNLLQTGLTRNLSSTDYLEGRFRRLRPGQDYDYDPHLGYISLRQRLSDGEALAVAYRYNRAGSTVEIGDFPESQTRNRLVLKMLRRSGEVPANPTWKLMLRNIYNVPGRNLDAGNFDLRIVYETGQTPSQTLPGVSVRPNQTLLQTLGLDRVNEEGTRVPDNRFDFLRGYTIDAANGRIIFPYLQPFGERIVNVLTDPERSDMLGQMTREQAVERYAFRQLYNLRRTEAQQLTQYDVYRIRGSYRGTVQDTYNLGFFGVVEGSVRVTSGGTTLSPGSDYVVDYSTGTVTITNPAYLTAGRDVRISYERNQIAAIQKKTLLGLRADYAFQDRFNLGATMMRLSEKSLVDKFRIGDEPIDNMIWGVDGAWRLEPQWLTRAIDALPLIQTRAPSSIDITGEFAQLIPGHAQTLAFTQRQRDLRRMGLDFEPDEQRGISYIDDFEGVRTTFSLMQPQIWNVASAPLEIRAADATNDSLRTNWRANLAWYSIPINLYRDMNIGQEDPAVRRILIDEAFPGRDIEYEPNKELQTFDLFFNPRERGPYNFTRDMPAFLNHPKDTWGGMTMALPDNYRDFSLQNVDALEFIFRPFSDMPGGDAGPDAKLHIEIGLISEDVIPNGELNQEDGLHVNRPIEQRDLDAWGRLPRDQPDGTVRVDRATKRSQDLGLNGLPSHNEFYSVSPYEVTERDFYSDFLEQMRLDLGENHPEYHRAVMDPAADDYFIWHDERYFGNRNIFPDGPRLQERFSRYFTGFELNSLEGQNEIIGGGRGLSRFPDTEDINRNGRLDTDNRYFQYTIPLSLSELEHQAQPGNDDNYVVGRIQNETRPNSFEWYLVRIPVHEFMKAFGGIQDFSRIEFIRVWTEGHSEPMTMRFARFDLVGNQWRKSNTIGERVNDDITNLFVSTINTEENREYRSPTTAIVAQQRLATGGLQRAREQSMLLRVQELQPEDERAVFRTYSQPQDLLRYSNVRMFVHGHGYERRNDLRVFVRLGHNATNDYYEYEQPVTPSDPTSGDPDRLWLPSENSVNIDLSAFNILKVSRDNALANGVARVDSLFTVEGETVEDFAPPGTRLGIVGNPSLARVTTIAIGIRNPSTGTEVLQDATIWVNELRVSGYDEDSGWAAIGNATFRLADLATVNASIRTQTDGFGGLASGLGERDNNNIFNYALTTNVNMHRFIPERFRWNIPVSYSVRSNVATPRFSPQRGDIRLDEILASIETDESLNEEQRTEARRDAVEAAQTANHTQSVSVSVSKSGSESTILNHTLDALSVNYSFSESGARNPSTRFNDNWQWSSGVTYRLNVRRPRTVRPFWFMAGLPILNILEPLRLNYVPQSISATARADRSFNASQERPRPRLDISDTTFVHRPDIINHPILENHRFGHRRTFNLQYNPLNFLSLGYDANTDQSLRNIGERVQTNVVTISRDGREERVFENVTLDQAIADGLIDTSAVFADQYDRLRVVPFNDVLGSIFSGGEGVRTNQHGQNFSATLRPQFNNSKVLDWVTIQPITYQGQFSWVNGPQVIDPSLAVGASVSNRVTLRGGVQFRVQELWRKAAFYRNLEEQQREAETRARNERTRREQERERRRQERQRSEENGDPNDVNNLNGLQPASQDTVREGRSFPLPNLGTLARRLFLTVTGIRELQVTYNRTESAHSGNVGGGFSLIDAFYGNAPSLAYRLGLQRSIPAQDRIGREGLQVTDRLQESDQVGARTSLTPSNHLRIDLTWDVQWSGSENYSFSYDANGNISSVASTRSGNNRSSIIGMGGSYADLLQRQLQTFIRDREQTPVGEPVGDATGDGRVALTQNSIVEDFTANYARTIGTIDSEGFILIPLPNWSINYTGLNQIDLIRRFTRSVTLTHRYVGTYETDFRSNDAAGQVRVLRERLGGRELQYVVPELEANSVRLNQQFNPLVGVNIGWRGDLQTDISWRQTNSRALMAGQGTITASATNEISLNASYSKRGLRLPFMGRALNNTIRLSMIVSRSGSVERLHRIRADLQDLLEGRELDDPIRNAITRSTAEPRLSYVFSNRVTADVFVRYEHLDSQGSQVPSTTNITGGFNFRVSISN